MAATDRTKTPEEIAKEEADRLHELETKRLARMNGDFGNDDLSDVSDIEDDDKNGKKRRKIASKTKELSSKKRKVRGDDELDSDDEDEDGDGSTMRFTSEGIVYLDKDGNVIPDKAEKDEIDDEASDDDSEEDEDHDDDSSSETEESETGLGDSDDDASAQQDDDDDDDEMEDKNAPLLLKEGTKIRGNYRAKDQFGGHATWYRGVISKVYNDEKGNTLYNVTYDDGDFEDGMVRENLKVVAKTKDQKDEEEKKKIELKTLAKKKKKAKELAR